MRREGYQRQRQKIAEFEHALIREGYFTLDAQAVVLGISRSTTWTVLRGAHKGSGLSPSVIIQMLFAPRLPPAVREWIHEYVKEKMNGSYGHERRQIRRFSAGLGIIMQSHLHRAAREVSDS